MNVILFGLTGMVGQGVLRECLKDSGVTSVLSVGRSSLDMAHPKLKNLCLKDLLNYQAVESELSGYDACFFCLGATAAGKTEQEYALINYDIPVAVGATLARIKPGMTFNYGSGAGTDSTEKGRTMWTRVKGKTENALLGLPLNAYMFRPAGIQPMHGEMSKTLAYRISIAALRPVFPLLRGLLPGFVTDDMGQALYIA